MQNKIKISQLPVETSLKEDALIPIVQDNSTKIVKSKDLLQSINDRLDNVSNKEVELQATNDYLQWKYKGDSVWKNLISIDRLKGAQGTNGVTPNISIGTVTTLEAGQKATVTKRGTAENPIFDFGIPKGVNGISGDALIDDSIQFSHLSQDLKQMYVTTEENINVRTTNYTKRANLTFTKLKSAGWCQVRIPLDISKYPNGNITIEIESYWKSTNSSTVPDRVVFYNTVYTCADDGRTEVEPKIIKDFPNLNNFTENQAYYSGSTTFTKNAGQKFVNIYTIPKGSASGVPHTAEIGVSLKVNGDKIEDFEFKEGMLNDVVEVSYLNNDDDMSITTGGLYFDGNYVNIDGKLLPDIIKAISNNTQQKHQWYGKKMNFLGDSITQGVGTTKTYHSYLQESLGLAASRNYGISGSSITDRNTPMHSRCLNMDNAADINFVFGGTNDFYFGVPLGEWYTMNNTVRTLNKDTSTFRGALNTLCCNLINKYPDKQIVLMTPLHRNVFGGQPTEYQVNSIGLYVEDYVKCIIEAGKIHSIPVIDLYAESGLRPSESASANLYFTGSDKLHPTAPGHQRIAKLIESKLSTIPVL